jgi:Mrp family chromosome partitioning ATPase
VLSNAVIAQLINLRDELSGTDETSCTLVRIASGIAGRSLKAHLAAQLAWLLAEDRRRRVLLVEADLDAPSLHEVLEINVPRGFGLSEQLERMQGTKLRDNLSATRIRLGDCLDALLESAWGSPALFQSPHFKRLLERERIDHDFIVVNGPVVGDWPDAQALPLPGSADSVVYVTPQLEAADRDILRGAATSFAGAAKLSIVESEQNHQHPSTPFQA